MRTIIKAGAIVLGLMLMFYLGYQVFLGISMSRTSKKAAERLTREFIASEFSGRFVFRNPQNLNCYLIFYVFENPDDHKEFETYNLCPCKNKEFQEFILDADSIVKQKNTRIVTIINKKNIARNFDFPLCD